MCKICKIFEVGFFIYSGNFVELSYSKILSKTRKYIFNKNKIMYHSLN